MREFAFHEVLTERGKLAIFVINVGKNLTARLNSSIMDVAISSLVTEYRVNIRRSVPVPDSDGHASAQS